MRPITAPLLFQEDRRLVRITEISELNKEETHNYEYIMQLPASYSSV
jgi:hypothetical protein